MPEHGLVTLALDCAGKASSLEIPNLATSISSCTNDLTKASRCRVINQFVKKEPKSRAPLNFWIKAAEGADWENPADVIGTFNNADCINNKWIFNIGGNNYRLAAIIWYEHQRVYVLKVMTHEEYDREVW